MNELITIILGGGRGTRLYPLTKHRAKPAVPIGGKYRLIDIPLSNCVHSGINRVFVLTQFMSVSLNRHISNTFNFDRLRGGFVDVIPATQSEIIGQDWFEGTADAVRKSMMHYRQHSFRDYLILSGDHLYRMNYRKLWRYHKRLSADVTVCTLPVPEERISEFGIMKVDNNSRITDFVEKPKDPDPVRHFRLNWPERLGGGYRYLASMGIYIFRREVLDKLLKDNTNNDFGYNIVPYAINNTKTVAYNFSGYWEDIGKIEDFFRANIALTDPKPAFTFYDHDHPIFTNLRTLPGNYMDNADISQSIITEGCIIKNCSIRNSIIGIRSVVGSGSDISETMMIGSDFYEKEQFYPDLKGNELPKLGIGKNCRIQRSIIDKNARIGNNVIITPKGKNDNYNGEGYVVRNGVTVIEKNAVILPGTII